MIYSVRGTVLDLEPFFAVVECEGTGYGIKITGSAYDYLCKNEGKKIFLHTRAVYKEDSSDLYGFSTKAEAKVFDLITDMQGFGPSIAMNLLSTLGAEGLLNSLLKQDASALVKVPKVGKGKADKILFEAKGKQKKLELVAAELGGTSGKVTFVQSADDEFTEMIHQALEGLGFQKKEIEKAAEKLKQNQTQLPEREPQFAQDYIREYLKLL